MRTSCAASSSATTSTCASGRRTFRSPSRRRRSTCASPTVRWQGAGSRSAGRARSTPTWCATSASIPNATSVSHSARASSGWRCCATAWATCGCSTRTTCASCSSSTDKPEPRMRVPENWLRSFASPDWTSEEIAERLTMAGLEVEETSAAAPPFHGVVVARVRSVARHPDADRLSVCEVDAGEGRLRTIVCGAPNVKPDMCVPCALPGAQLPGGLEIKPVKMRGVQSEGMLCSARELGLSEDHSGLMSMDVDAPPGADLRGALELDEAVHTLKLTPNLAHCMSIHGVARELSAIAGVPLREPMFEPAPVELDERLPVKIAAADLCGRFSGRVIRDVNPRAPTPAWMRQRLERAGQRSISALVDISNYVMLELGRPSHVFDLDRIEGGLEVRWARDGEQLKLLNGQTVALAPDVGVIADARQVESLAGIMGGDSTAVSDDTRNVYLEAAFWWPRAIAGRSRRYNFATDAGARFERGVDPATTVEHIEYLTRLILQVCGGRAGPVDDTVTSMPGRDPVGLRVARARKVIGVDIAEAEIA